MGLIIVLSLLGLVLVCAEVILVPGVGIAGILGIGSMAGSCYLAFSGYGTVAGAIVTSVDVVLVVVLTIYMLRAKTWRKLALRTNIDSKAVPQGKVEVVVGDVGKTATRLAPMGTARINGVALEVKSLEGMIDPGMIVEVVMIEDGKIYVKPVGEDC
ncbi:MAG: NfeD family protein [Candidatus Cryptobacteroides sp.]